MAPVLSQSEIQEITRLLEQGKALPEKYREVLFVDRQFRSEEHAAGNPEQSGLAAAPCAPPTVQSSEPNTTAFSITGLCKFLLDDPQTQLTINKYVSMVVSKARGQLPPLAIKCTGEIIEIVPQILNQHWNNDYVLRWRNTKLPDDIRRQLYRVIHERLIQREFEVTREREVKEREREAKAKVEEQEAVERLLAKYEDLISTFLTIAERKVSVLDEYGDEQLYLLHSLVDDCVAKIAGREGKSETHTRAELKKDHSCPRQCLS